MNPHDRELQSAMRATNKQYYNQISEKDNLRKREKQRNAQDSAKGLLRICLIGAGILLAVLLLDGFRRDYGNLSGTLMAFNPDLGITVRSGVSPKQIPAKEGMSLSVDTNLSTGPTGTATLAFPDGSSLKLEPSTQFDIRLLDYQRGGKRDRSFMMAAGGVMVRVSKNFGKGGQTVLCTGNAVATARSSAGFRVTTAGETTTVDVVHGKVVFRSAGGRVELGTGQRGSATGGDPPAVSTAVGSQPHQQLFNRMARFEITPNFWTNSASKAAQFVDPLLQRIGLTVAGWNPQDTDISRKSATVTGLRNLRTILSSGEIPERLNPATLQEVNPDPAERDRVLKTFAGFTLDSYQKRGNGYAVRVRSRDHAGTVFELTPNGPRELGPG